MRIGLGFGLILGAGGASGSVSLTAPTLTVPENSANGTTVGTISVVNGSGTYTYSLTDSAGGKFAINSSTGVVTVAAALDYETAQSHSITVTASNGVDADLTRTFTVFVTDVVEVADSYIVYAGSSTMQGARASSNSIHIPDQVASLAGLSSGQWVNHAIGGSYLSEWASDATTGTWGTVAEGIRTRLANSLTAATQTNKVLVFYAGSNDFGGYPGISAPTLQAQLRSDLATFIAAMQAAVPGVVICLCTMNMTGYVQDNPTALFPVWQNYNDYQRQQADLVADFASDGRLYDVDNATYYHSDDRLHLTDTGYQVAGPIVHRTLANASLIGGAASTTDTEADQFTFTDATNAALSSTVSHAALAIAGTNALAAYVVTGGTVSGGTVGSSKGTGNYTIGTFSPGDSLTVTVTTSASSGATTDAILTAGGKTDTFSATTEANLPSASFTADVLGISGTATRTASGASIGAAAATRSLIIAVCNSSARALSSLTITPKTGATTHSAVTATQIFAHSGTTGPGITWYAANVPDGTTADLAAAYTSDPFNSARFVIFRAVDLATPLAAVDADELFTATTGTTASRDLTTSVNGIICAVSINKTTASQTGGTITGDETFTDTGSVNSAGGLYLEAGYAIGVAAATEANTVSSTFGLGGDMRLSVVSMR